MPVRAFVSLAPGFRRALKSTAGEWAEAPEDRQEKDPGTQVQRKHPGFCLGSQKEALNHHVR